MRTFIRRTSYSNDYAHSIGILLILCWSLSHSLSLYLEGVCGPVQAVTRVPESIQEGAQLHETGALAQVPGDLRPREGDQGGQPVAGAVRKVSSGMMLGEEAHFYTYFT